MRKNEQRLRVVDPSGQVHELTSRNAYDCINHHGWTMEKTEEDVKNENAHADRKIVSIEEQLKQKRVEREAEGKAKARAADGSKPKGVDTSKAKPKVPNRGGQSGPLEPTKSADPSEVYARMDAMADLEALEAEEDKRLGGGGPPAESAASIRSGKSNARPASKDDAD